MNLGKVGEEIASHYLRRKGYKILEKNFRTKIGEVDLILQKGEEIIFCEVKTRTDEEFGKPFEAVNEYKQKRLRRLAEYYFQKKSLESPLRFDVISILLEGKKPKEIIHIENAF